MECFKAPSTAIMVRIGASRHYLNRMCQLSIPGTESKRAPMSSVCSILIRFRSTCLVLLSVFALVSAFSAPTHAQNAEWTRVRVDLSQESQAAPVTVPPVGAVLGHVDTGDTSHLSPGTTLTFRRNGNQMEAAWGRESITGRAFTLTTEPGQVFEIGSRSYTGSLDIRVDGRTGRAAMTNIVPIEDYVAAVVSAEYGLNDVEGARAMAIVARTYALATMQSGRVLRDDERSQVYRGHGSVTPAARKAARDTAGRVLMHNGELVEAVYSSSNGGYTASNTSVWDTPSRPYLAARKDPYDAVSPHSQWQFNVDKKVLHDLLSRRYGANIQEVRVLDTAKDGRVRSVELRAKGAGDRVISGTAFRAALAAAYGPKSARSTYFSLDDRGRTYRLDGRGFGHGVGLSQWGAHGRALDGQLHQDILAFYYPGSRLVQLSPASVPAAPALAAVPAPRAPSQPVSDAIQVTQEKKSGRVLDAHSAWGRASVSEADTPETRTQGARVGW